MLSSRDGFCTIVVFDEILPAYHTQQQTLQLQSIAHHHSVPITFSTPTTTPSATPTLPSVSLPSTKKPRGVEDEDEGKGIGVGLLSEGEGVADAKVKVEEPPKKKRRVVLTRVGDLES
jgi:chromatin assembly factor 1 subunit B